jgi:hypothetical protein
MFEAIKSALTSMRMIWALCRWSSIAPAHSVSAVILRSARP